jgi:hypothetical protein
MKHIAPRISTTGGSIVNNTSNNKQRDANHTHAALPLALQVSTRNAAHLLVTHDVAVLRDKEGVRVHLEDEHVG